jgi:PKD repeat protein
VADTISPVVICPGNQTETPGAGCTFTLPDYSGLVTATDNCAIISVTQSPIAGTVISTNAVITMTAQDVSGNSSTCTFQVILSDAVPPTAVCQNITVYLDGSGNASILAADLDGGSSDNCSGLTFSASQTSFTCANVGANSVTLTVTDGNSNAASCVATVTVLDTISPVAVCQNINVFLNGAGSATVFPGDIDAGSVDNCGIGGLSNAPAVFTCANVGSNSVLLTVTDVNGNTGTCTSTVTVIDTISPVAQCQNISIYLNAAGNASLTGNDLDGGSTDNCGTLTYAASQTSFTCANVGANNVVLTVTDLSGNTSSCTAVVTVLDTVSPSVICQNITAYLDGAGNVTITPGDVDGGSTDNCSTPTLSLNTSAFTCANLGANTVTLTATDGSGNSASCSAIVTVVDTISPVVVCPGTQTETLDGTCNFTLSDYTGLATTTDNCTLSPIVTQSPLPGTVVSGIGSQTITLTSTDGSGNTSVCSFTVLTIDNTAPTITCPGTQTGVAGANCMFTVPDYTGLAIADDNCSALVTVSQSPAPGSMVGVGTTAILLTVSDGNLTSSCTFDLNVSGVTAAFTPSATSGCLPMTVNFTDVSVNATSWQWDFGNGDPLSSVQNPSGVMYNSIGSYTVTLIVGNGNGCFDTLVSTNAITVNPPLAAFTASPTIGCSIPHTVFFTDQSTSPDIWFWDFGDLNTSVAQNPIHSYTSYGTFTVTLTVTNTSSGCSSTATTTIIVDDILAPTVSCPGNQTEPADANCAATLSDYTGMATVFDACDPSPTVFQSPAAGTSFSGTQLVWLYGMDAAGNIDSCSFDVTVVDVTDPDLPVLPTLTGACSVSAATPTTTDNCAGVITGTTTDPLFYDVAGTYTIQWTFNDGSGNSITVPQSVVVNNSSSSSSLSAQACYSYTGPSGTVYTSSGVFVDTIPNAAGCDSLITLNLTINTEVYHSFTVTKCVEYTVPSGNMTYYASGVYTDTIPTVNGCDSIMTITVTIYTVDVSVTQTGNTLTANATNATFQWIDCADGNDIIGATDATFSPTYNGDFAVVVFQNGCYDTSPCYTISTIGLDELNESAVVVYPNPSTTGVFSIAYDGVVKAVQIVDMLGRVIAVPVDLESGLVDGSLLESGSYILRILTDQDRVILKDITIAR